MPANSVGFSIYSPPFSHLFIYSDSERDMGNAADDAEFLEHYGFLLRELHRVTKPGRLTAVHCTDMPRTKSMHGEVGLWDMPGDIIEAHTAAGWTYHSRITIWKDPVVEMQRTKAHGLLYKTLCKDSSRSRQGLPDYLLIFRKTPDDEKSVDPVGKDRALFPVSQWQQWASPVWMDINQTDVLNVRGARDEKDEKHLCPLQLDLIERAIRLWSNEGDVIMSPFMGIGSEGWGALKCKRRFVGFELKESYYRQAIKNMTHMSDTAYGGDLFEGAAA
ncbi:MULTISPECIES: site-specific DNA-methyltransferase [unclassified Mesorhizobium]|uniref:DNA-methyltransferase n=1 Tax=unclassified Mesorhizobium TaxID=325217 RepID=UPI001FEEDB8B|nr:MULTISPECIES: site-specific DNA-methyltransferase [unclassified Mesorhizobium]